MRLMSSVSCDVLGMRLIARQPQFDAFDGAAAGVGRKAGREIRRMGEVAHRCPDRADSAAQLLQATSFT